MFSPGVYTILDLLSLMKTFTLEHFEVIAILQDKYCKCVPKVDQEALEVCYHVKIS